MKIFLIGNYPLLGTTSMYLYANLLKKIIKKRGHRAEILRPAVVLNKYDFFSNREYQGKDHKIIDDPKFWEDQDYLRIYEKNV